MAPSDRRFFANVLLFAFASLGAFGWLFLAAGTGAPLLTCAALALAGAVLMSPTRTTIVGAGVAALIAGAPIVIIVVHFLVVEELQVL